MSRLALKWAEFGTLGQVPGVFGSDILGLMQKLVQLVMGMIHIIGHGKRNIGNN